MYAEVISVDPSWLAEVPAGLDDVLAAAVPLGAETGTQAVDLAGISAGQTVLITGASGSVGGFATQHAVALGGRVVAVASAGDEDFVAALGAHVVLRRDGGPEKLVAAARAAVPEGFDAVVDVAGTGGDLLPVVRDGGVFIAVSGPEQPPSRPGVQAHRLHVQPRGDQLAGILADLAAGRAVTRVGLVLPLEEAAEAHRRAERRDIRGKIVLTL
ncbi:hypothetical protein Ato02nite_047900 [Paractinoplanes toevensis]|uniref:Uncharacterized protein n=1 Tax=Paractinoplanes toevensis TaxID=571911 RepID=A0A919TDB3_9ACTN|nr:hypothetical protein Ato02nite_047900 [Actinoplanes toevensis]